MRIKQIGFKKVFLLPLLVVSLLSATLIASPTARADDQPANDEVTCAIDMLGWILCPVIQKAGVVGDQAFQLLSKNFLETDPELVSSGASGTYTAWELARNIANILFIAAFLIIILAQVTGRAIDNYGIKKLLPKLIIAAIAVNISYYICQLMVDLTNIIGYETENFMVHTAAQVSDQSVLPVNTGWNSTKTDNGALGTMATWIVATAAVVWFLLPVLFLGVSTVVITCLVIIFILLMRKAFIVLLVVVSPIAFVAYLLPNTEKYFQKWLSMFWQLLLVFPVVSLLFGGGQLASAIVLKAGTNTTGNSSKRSVYDDTTNKCIELPKTLIPTNTQTNTPNPASSASIKECDKGSTPVMLGLVAAGIAVAPLFAVWAVLKGALSAAGAIGGKIAGAIQNGGNGLNKNLRRPEDGARKWAFNAAKGWATDKVVTDALDGKGRIGKYGGARIAGFVRRQQRNKALREQERATALARFDNNEGADMTHAIMAQKELENAAGIAGQRDFLAKVDNEAIIIGERAGGDLTESMETAIKTLEKRAADEVIKGIKEAFHTTDIGESAARGGNGVRAELDRALEAAKSGDKSAIVRARAMQDMLMGSGSAGRTAFRESMEGAGIEPGGDTNDINDALRQNIQTNNAAAKDKDAALKQWADKGGDLTKLFKYGDYKGVDSVQKFLALDGEVQKQAAKNMDPGQLQNIIAGIKRNPSSRDNLHFDLRRDWGV